MRLQRCCMIRSIISVLSEREKAKAVFGGKKNL